MTLPFALPDWLPWWLPIVLLVPLLLYVMALLVMSVAAINLFNTNFTRETLPNGYTTCINSENIE